MSQELLTKQLAALMKGDSPEVIAAALGDLGYVLKPTAAAQTAMDGEVAAKIAAATESGAATARAAMTEIAGLCELGGMPQMLAPLLRSGASVESARVEIVNAKAAAGSKTPIISTVGGGDDGEVNYLLQDAQARSGSSK